MVCWNLNKMAEHKPQCLQHFFTLLFRLTFGTVKRGEIDLRGEIDD